MKTKGKIILFGIFLIIILIASFMVYRIFNPTASDKELNLSLFEKRWIEENKNEMIDIAVLNDLPIYGNSGKGIIFYFLQDLETETELEFNKISYTINDKTPNSQYTFEILKANENVGKNDLLIYEDNYVILSKSNDKVNNINNMGAAKIGVLKEDLSSVSSYLSNNNGLSYTPTDNINLLLPLFDNDDVQYIIVPRNVYLNYILQKDYKVVYMFNDLSKKYVLSLSEKNTRLNDILKKYYNVWMNNNFTVRYNEEMFNYYCSIKGVDDETRTAFMGKRYIFGYVDNVPYEVSVNDNFSGISSEFTKGFANFANIEFTYKNYKTVALLDKALKEGKVDVVFDYYNFKNINNNFYHTIGTVYSNYVILANKDNNKSIDSLKGMTNVKLFLIKDTILANNIKEKTNASVKLVNNIDDLTSDDNALVLVDYNTYEYYKNRNFKNYHIVYQDNLASNYDYLVRKISQNDLFYNMFQYYLMSVNHNKFKYNGMNNLIFNSSWINLSVLWIYIILIPILLVIVIILLGKRKQIKRVKNYAKSKFIDPLTSLKNRYYLSQNIQKWEDNNNYPQAVVVIDLNDLKEINDSYGHDEGDNVIKATANILINNQLEKTEIIRTDGDEFMIYMVGYNETQVVAYIRKLYRFLKDLPYDHGASLGYSMILDDIKLIDDAINEAVLDMITNKENKKNNES